MNHTYLRVLFLLTFVLPLLLSCQSGGEPKYHIGVSQCSDDAWRTKLNEEMLPLIEAYPPPSMKGKYIKIKYCSQVPDTRIPTFVFYANLPQYVKEPYKRFLENKIRERWDFSGTPINLFVRQK